MSMNVCRYVKKNEIRRDQSDFLAKKCMPCHQNACHVIKMPVTWVMS
ncbi:hypothetical protein C5167_047020 [Papaver somniferum]|uniref:Uncharacterized protein n=1 Tax=Papaver somniferum TaxID=3469 RepID=A0A4Y7LGZ4_PAPSO|nr:hypothetical protein C5167_047020 [Papaver somniferum]